MAKLKTSMATISILVAVIFGIILKSSTAYGACVGPNSYDNENYNNIAFKLWDWSKNMGFALNPIERLTHETYGDYDSQKLAVTTTYADSLEVLIDSNYFLVLASDTTTFLDIHYNMTFIKFDSGAMPVYLDSSIDVSTGIELFENRIWIRYKRNVYGMLTVSGNSIYMDWYSTICFFYESSVFV